MMDLNASGEKRDLSMKFVQKVNEEERIELKAVMKLYKKMEGILKELNEMETEESNADLIRKKFLKISMIYFEISREAEKIKKMWYDFRNSERERLKNPNAKELDYIEWVDKLTKKKARGYCKMIREANEQMYETGLPEILNQLKKNNQ